MGGGHKTLHILCALFVCVMNVGSKASTFAPHSQRRESRTPNAHAELSFARTPVTPPLGFASGDSGVSAGEPFSHGSVPSNDLIHSASSPQLFSDVRPCESEWRPPNISGQHIFSTPILPSDVASPTRRSHLCVGQGCSTRDSPSRSTSSDRRTLVEDANPSSQRTHLESNAMCASSAKGETVRSLPIQQCKTTELVGAASGEASYFEFPRVVCPRSKSRGDSSRDRVIAQPSADAPHVTELSPTKSPKHLSSPRAQDTAFQFFSRHANTPSPQLQCLGDIHLRPNPIARHAQLSCAISGVRGISGGATADSDDANPSTSVHSATMNVGGRLLSLAPASLSSSDGMSRTAKICANTSAFMKRTPPSSVSVDHRPRLTGTVSGSPDHVSLKLSSTDDVLQSSSYSPLLAGKGARFFFNVAVGEEMVNCVRFT